MEGTLFELTNPQKSIWFIEQFFSNTTINNICGTLIIRDEVNFINFEKAIDIFIKRNDSFRLRFKLVKGNLVQYVDKFIKKEIELIEIQNETELKDLEEKMTNTFLDIKSDKLFEFKMFKYPNKTGGFVVNVHHIISDAATFALIGRKIMQYYIELERNEVKSEEPIYSYIDYINSEKEYLESERFKKDKEYWNNKFEILPEIASLPTNKKIYKKIENGKSKRIEFSFNKDIIIEIESVCKEYNISIFNFFMAVYAIYIGRVTNLNDFVIGTPVLNRGNVSEKNTAGMFISTTALRINFKETLNFSEFVKQIAKDSLGLLKHRKYPYQLLLEDLRTKDNNIPNIYDIVLSYQITKATDKTMEIPYETRWTGSNYISNSLNIHLHDNNDIGELIVSYDYQLDKYTKEDIEKMHGSINIILEQILENVEILLNDIEIITKEEKQRIFENWNNTYLEYPNNETIITIFEENAKKMPDNIAVVFENEKVTFKTLNEKANQLARYLNKYGIGRQEYIPIFMNKNINLIIAILAIQKINCIYVPIYSDCPRDRIKYIIGNCMAKFLLTDIENNLIIENVKNLNINKLNYTNERMDNLENKYKTDDICYAIYTSGSTGKPKGVNISNKNLMNFIYSFNSMFINKFSKRDKCLSVTNISFDVSIAEIFTPLILGSTLVLYNENVITDIINLCNVIESEEITFLYLPPNILKFVYECIKQKDIKVKINKMLVGVEPIKNETLNNFLELNDDMEIINGYGPTETTICATFFKFTKNDDKFKIVPIGVPLKNNKAFIVSKSNRLQPIGVKGELIIAGDNVGKGYINDVELTNKSFIEFYGKIAYKTGDIAYLDEDGVLRFVGRNDSQIKFRGYRIELGEINNNILNITEVKNSFTTIKKINEIEHICAYVVLNDFNKKIDIKKILSKKIPHYMVPTYITFLEELPTTINGKVDAKRLPKIKIQFKKDVETTTLDSKMEKELKQILQKILNIERIDKDDNFFEIGGDSLTAIRYISDIDFLLNIKISIKDIFENQTIRELAEFISKSDFSKNDLVEIKRQETKEYYPLASAQKIIYYSVKKAGKDSIIYNMPVGIILNKIPDLTKLENSFKSLIRRHSILRTKFKIENEDIVQIVEENTTFSLKVKKVDLIDEKIEFDEFVRPFDLEKGNLLRAKVVTDLDKKALLLIDTHHIVCDGRSVNILIDELNKIYNDEKLENIELEYKDFAIWEQKLILDGTLNKSQEYWRKQFKDKIPELNMPIDQGKNMSNRYIGEKKYNKINQELSKKIEKLSIDKKTTPYMIYLACYFILLSKYTGQDDIVIGTPIAGRLKSNLNNLVGMFVNTLPMRSKIENNCKFDDYLKSVKTMCIENFEHQIYPFNELVQKLDNIKDNRNPIFDVMFVYQNEARKDIDFRGIKSHNCDMMSNIAKFDLTLEVTPLKKYTELSLEYNIDLFGNGRIERMMKHYINILQEITSNTNIDIKDINILSEQEEKELLKFNNRRMRYPKNVSIIEQINEQISKRKNSTAIIYKNQEIKYKELNQQAESIANKLIERGIQKGDVVATFLDRSPELIASILAILRVGAVYLPILRNYPLERVKYILEDSNAKLIITKKLEYDLKIDVFDINRFEIVHNKMKLTNMKYERNDIIYIIYTSGSTGNPKGVYVTSGNLNNFIHSFNKLFERVNSKDRFLVHTNITFDVSIWEIFFAIMNGATLCLYDEPVITDIFKFCNYIIKQKITTCYIPPNILDEVYNILCKSKNLKLEKILVGVEPIKNSILRKYFDLNQNMKIINGYGPTETTICSTAYEVTKRNVNFYPFIPIGKPLHNLETYVLDKNLNLVPIGIVGELFIVGDNVTKGYINNEELTNKNYVKIKINGKEKYAYKTGDLVKWNKLGILMFVGRNDTQVKINGHRIELNEIENNMYAYSDINKSIVKVKEFEDGTKKIVAYFTAKEKVNISKLRAFLRNRLPSYYIPNFFVQIEKFKINENGKIDKKELDKIEIITDSEYEKPHNEFQKILVEIWKKILKLDRISINDNFFELGGDSLLAIKLQIESVNRNLDISYSDIFEKQTIKELTNNNLNKKEKIDEKEYLRLNNIIKSNKLPLNKIEKINLKNILLIGVTGFVGSHLLDSLLKETNANIYCLIRKKNGEDIRKKTRIYFRFLF